MKVPEMFRGTCECGKWMMILPTCTLEKPYVCVCGRTYWYEPETGLLHRDESTKYRHKEAFCLMWYQCERCGVMEQFWNSRDGVTPFVVGGVCVVCDGDMQHIAWQRDEYRPDWIPDRGQGVFFDMPESFKRLVALARVRAADGTRFEVQGERREEVVRGIMEEFQPGAPWFGRW